MDAKHNIGFFTLHHLEKTAEELWRFFKSESSKKNQFAAGLGETRKYRGVMAKVSR